MVFWSTAAQVAVRMEAMRKAEAGLIALARRFGQHEPSSYKMELFDTEIPVSVLPFKGNNNNTAAGDSGGWSSLLPFGLGGSSDDGGVPAAEEHLTMHAIRVTSSAPKNDTPDAQQQQQQHYPLVIVHGYMNGALYFYRNLASLAGYFDTVISVDLLGWGLSSRPSIDRLVDDSVETAEAFFVESLESWRSKNNIEKMTLAGHSMGGYLSVAYCEKYPERVDQLLLLSPVGVPEETQEDRDRRNARYLNSYPRRFLYGLFGSLWESGTTPGSIMRSLTEYRGRALVEGYVQKRLPSIRDPTEQAVLSDYMYLGSILPGSGEYFLNRILDPGALAKKPCLRRIPKLGVRKVSFLYGTHDWMDVRAGLGVRELCRNAGGRCPDVQVYQVPKAGHLLMLENPEGFDAAVVLAAGGKPLAAAADLPMVPPDDALPGLQRASGGDTRDPGGSGGGVSVAAQ